MAALTTGRKSQATTACGRMAAVLFAHGVADRDVYVAVAVLLTAGFSRRAIRSHLRAAQALARFYSRGHGSDRERLGAPADGGPRRAATAARPVAGHLGLGRPPVSGSEHGHAGA